MFWLLMHCVICLDSQNCLSTTNLYWLYVLSSSVYDLYDKKLSPENVHVVLAKHTDPWQFTSLPIFILKLMAYVK